MNIITREHTFAYIFIDIFIINVGQEVGEENYTLM